MFDSQSSYARPLFDQDGGPARAFECRLYIEVQYNPSIPCGKVCRTEKGMRAHLRKCHGWIENPTLPTLADDAVVPGITTTRQKRIRSLKVGDLPASRRSIPAAQERPAIVSTVSVSVSGSSNLTPVKSS